MITAYKKGREVQVGDALVFLGRSHRITRLESYDGPISHVFRAGARIAHVEGHGPYMMLPNDDLIEVAA